MRIPQTIEERKKRPGNLVNKVRLAPEFIRGFLAFLSGTCLSSVFPPLEWSCMTWFSLVPLLFLAIGPNGRPFRLGYLFGFGHFVTTFWWLSEVFILAPIGVAAIQAVFPAIWLMLLNCMVYNATVSPKHDLLPRNDPSIPHIPEISQFKILLIILSSGCIWCAMEWCRSWFLSGFPWNQLGVSQWQNPALLPILSITGVYGISFIAILANTLVYFTIKLWLPKYRLNEKPPILGPILFITVVVVLVGLSHGRYKTSGETNYLKVAAIQGNIPQSRFWSPEQLNLALEVYTSLTKEIVKKNQPDLVLWPETAIPASLLYNEQCNIELRKLFSEIKVPMLAGSIDYKFPPGKNRTNESARCFNSALLFDSTGTIVDRYDKIHLVPFGEYVPFEDYLPLLVEWIGMGRSLFEGLEYSVLTLKKGVRIGVNICFEDIFTEISSRMVLNGANVLFVITNDAWFRQSSGSRQHLAHTVMRAAEHFRPILRNGNNSDTCLISPMGKIENILYEPNSGNRFFRGAKMYSVPIWEDPPVTFYTRHGNWFAVCCFIVMIFIAIWCSYRYLDRKCRLFEIIIPVQAP